MVDVHPNSFPSLATFIICRVAFYLYGVHFSVYFEPPISERRVVVCAFGYG